MIKEKNEVEDIDNSQIIASLITKTIVDFCMKSEKPIDLTYIVKALSDVIAAHLATMTEGWSDAQVEKCINMIFNHIVSTMKDCKNGIEDNKNPN
jgi:hypothetical protein